MHYRFYITIALLLTATIANHVFSAPEAELTRRPLSNFPKAFGDWRAINENKIGESSMAVLQVDDYIMRTYANKQGETIGLYIGYFEVQREGKGIHSPRQCLPGAGWSIIKKSEHQISMKNHNPVKVPINLHLMGKGDQRQLYLWWYYGRGRIYANEYMNKLYHIWDAMTKRRTDGALVRVNMAVNSDLDQTLKAETCFINLITPILSRYIPN
jgi:EpsI family protein